MTNNELKRFLFHYLEPKIKDDFIFHKNILYQKSESGFLKGFCFEKSSYRKDGFYLWCFVQPLYVPSEDIVLTYGKRIQKHKDEWWKIDERDEQAIKNIVIDLNNSIKQEGTTYIEETSIPEGFCNTFDKQKELNIRIWEAIVYTSLYNNSPNAEKEAETFITLLKEQNSLISWVKNIKMNIELLLSKTEIERKQLLKMWEKETLETLKLVQ